MIVAVRETLTDMEVSEAAAIVRAGLVCRECNYVCKCPTMLALDDLVAEIQRGRIAQVQPAMRDPMGDNQ